MTFIHAVSLLCFFFMKMGGNRVPVINALASVGLATLVQFCDLTRIGFGFAMMSLFLYIRTIIMFTLGLIDSFKRKQKDIPNLSLDRTVNVGQQLNCWKPKIQILLCHETSWGTWYKSQPILCQKFFENIKRGKEKCACCPEFLGGQVR